MYDEDAESDECEKITCPHCGTDSNNECPHLLMLYDVTFCQCEGGVAFDHQERFQSQVSAAFTRLLTEGAKPTWSHFEVAEVWDGVLEEGVEDPEDIDVRGKPFLDLMASVLEAAGGCEYPGSLVSGSGAYCESSVRLLYAEDPEKVCKKAETVLEAWLKPEEPKKKRKRS